MAIITEIATAMMTVVIIVRINSIVHNSNSTEVRVVMTVENGSENHGNTNRPEQGFPEGSIRAPFIIRVFGGLV